MKKKSNRVIVSVKKIAGYLFKEVSLSPIIYSFNQVLTHFVHYILYGKIIKRQHLYHSQCRIRRISLH